MSGQPIAVVAGASGFIGRAAIASFEEDGYDVREIGRNALTRWGDQLGIERVVNGADVLVNLSGKSVKCRYTDANRDEILRSRVETTRQLHEAVAVVAQPPRVWLNASAAHARASRSRRPAVRRPVVPASPLSGHRSGSVRQRARTRASHPGTPEVQLPETLTAAGFEFRHPHLAEALLDVAASMRR